MPGNIIYIQEEPPVIKLYKRLVFWNLRVLENLPLYRHIPGWQRSIRFQRRHYERHFWTTWVLNAALSVASGVLSYKLSMYLVQKLEERTITLDMSPEEARDLGERLVKI